MILRNIRLARPADDIDLSDLTASVRTGPAYWCSSELDTLVMPMDPEPAPAEAAAIRRRLVTVDEADEQHLGDLLAAHQDPAAPQWARVTLAAELGRYGDPADLA